MTPSQEMEADIVHKEGGKKEQAQENSNQFNSIWVSFSYLRILFFNLMGKKGGYLNIILCCFTPSFSRSLFVCPGRKSHGLLQQ